MTKAQVKRHAKRGLSAREIALLLGVSTQMVHKHLNDLRAAGELPERESVT